MMFGARLNKLGAAVKSRPPTASFNFALAGQTLDSRITFSRASSATYFDNTGTLQTASSGVARANAYQDHNPTTLAPLGFLIEEQRTNSIRNNTMVGAAAGVLPTNYALSGGGAATASVVGGGTEKGVAYVEIRFQGASGLNTFLLPDAIGTTAATAGQAWTGSLFSRLIAGSYSGISQTDIAVTAYSAALANLGDSSAAFTATSSAIQTQRKTVSYTTPVNTAWVVASVRVLASAAYDITLRIGLPQLELGAFATSPILTTTAAATRIADVASITGTNFSGFWNASEGTVVVSAVSAPVNNVAQYAFNVNNATTAESFFLRRNTSGIMALALVDSSVTQGDIGSTVIAGSGSYKCASVYKLNDLALVTNTGTAATDALATMPTVTQMDIGGSLSAASPINGHIQSLTYYNKRLSNATLQALTV